jgi:hypothetical protein
MFSVAATLLPDRFSTVGSKLMKIDPVTGSTGALGMPRSSGRKPLAVKLMI